MNDRITALQALKNLKEEALALYPIGDTRKSEAKEWIKIIECELTNEEYIPSPDEVDWLTPEEIADEFDWLTPEEIADEFELAVSTVRTYTSLYDIETKKERGRRYINFESFKQFLFETGRWKVE